MPIYEYRCLACGKQLEALQKVSDRPLRKCPTCAGKLEKLISRTSFQLKGGGWYASGYAKSSPSSKSDGDAATNRAYLLYEVRNVAGRADSDRFRLDATLWLGDKDSEEPPAPLPGWLDREIRPQVFEEADGLAEVVEASSLEGRRVLALDAERDLFDAELNLARLQRDERLNIVGLYRALGGGWESVAAAGNVASLSRPDK